MMELHPQTVKDAVAQIEKCNFECEAGPMANNVGWQWVKACLEVGPEFWPGQSVWFLIDAKAAGKTLTQWVRFFIVGCHMNADTERRYWTYDLSYDPPAPWHYGETHFRGIRGDKLFIEKPSEPE
jgi:hypothetical protein